MNILYDVKKKTIRELKEGSEEIKLTKLENRLIALLSNDLLNTWEDVGLFVYNEFVDRSLMNNINCLINRLNKKFKLDIIHIHDYGIRLRDNVFIK